MKRFKDVRRSLSMLLVMVMILAMTAVPTLANSQLAMLTLDSSNFTIVGNINDIHVIEAKGLDSSYGSAPVDPTKVVWESLNPSVATVSQSGAEATVTLVGVGEAEVRASYTDSGVAPVSSNIVVEGPAEGPVNSIKITIKDDQGTTVVETTLNDFDVFSLKTVYGSSFDDADVLKNNPSVLHALVKALGDDPSKAVISSGGSYVDGILGIFSEYDPATGSYLGWHYRVNGSLPDKSASMYQLKTGDTIEWFYGPMFF